MPRAQRKQLERNEIIKYVYKSNDFIALQMLILIAVGLQIRQSSSGVLSVFLKGK